VHWTYDTWMLANGTGSAIVKTGGDSWFFITADYAFGHALERDTEAVVQKNGGKVLGKVRAPLNTQDFSSFLLQAQGSKAKIIGLANAGRRHRPTRSSRRPSSASSRAGRSLAGLLVFLSDVHGLGLQTAQGLIFTETFYWDLNDGTRAFAKRMAAANNGKYPTMVQAGVYSGVLHYLKAIEAAKTDDGTKVVEQMKKMPTDDPAVRQGPHPRRRPQAAPGVPGGSEEALGVEGAVRLLQDPLDHSGRPGVSSGEGRRLRAGEVAAAKRQLR
jgi:branched-chain amino acid transport system substrate-binding protein